MSIDRTSLTRLLAHGDISRLGQKIDLDRFSAEIAPFSSNWVRYNPYKMPNNRWGLSLTSLDGGMSGVPDLTSLREHNREFGTSYTERDFSVETPAYKALTCLRPMLDKLAPLGRTHILRLDAGGFFPPHRDGLLRESTPGTLRVLMPLNAKLTSDDWIFMYDGKPVQFEPGFAYFVNTWKMHSVFSYRDDCMLLVVNIPMSDRAVDAVIDLFSYR